MDSSLIIADLREQFGAKKAVLYVEELAIVLGRTVDALYTLNSRNTLPIPCMKVGGRFAVSIYDVAEWLSGNIPKQKRSKALKQEDNSVADPKRTRKSLGAALRQIQAQQGFLGELAVALQNQLDRSELAREGFPISQAVFDDEPDLFFVDHDGVVMAYARDEETSPRSEVDMEWLTWTAALAKPWRSEEKRIEWITLAESETAGITSLVHAERDAIPRRI